MAGNVSTGWFPKTETPFNYTDYFFGLNSGDEI